MKIVSIIGARPQFIKAAVVSLAIEEHNRCVTSRLSLVTEIIVYTGQHYDKNMAHVFFKELEIPRPHYHLQIGSGSHGVQTGRMLEAIEQVLLKERPNWVLVYGDTNSTLAGALAAVKLHIPVAHVEAGLRSFDRRMPEEINRVLTDAVSDFLFTTCADANENLLREGISPEKIFFVGNVMIDSLMKFREKSKASCIVEDLGLKRREYVLMTLHRPSNVDKVKNFRGLLEAVREIQRRLPVVFPIHPRSRKMLQELGLQDEADQIPNLRIIQPLGYVDFLRLMDLAQLVLTDSGGIQEETTVLGIPCLTLRENTERPVTVHQGTNQVVGSDPKRITQEAILVLEQRTRKPSRPKFWDGRAAHRIVDVLLKTMSIPGAAKTRRRE